MNSAVRDQGTSFNSDLEYLQKHGDVILLKAPSGGRVVVSPRYQGRVMTSAVRESGRSLGWVNRAAIDSGAVGTAFDNYGGEDRFWLGPEAGQYALFFKPGQAYDVDLWQTPAGFQEGTWDVLRREEQSVDLRQSMRVQNQLETVFDLQVERGVSVLAAEQVSSLLGVQPAPNVEWVAHQTRNQVTNTGPQAWSEQTGLISVWILGMFAPAADTWVLAPFNQAGHNPIVNADYFNPLGPERLVVDEQHSVVRFLADGLYRSKIGLSQSRSMPVAGSYTASEGRLTIIQYTLPSPPKPYVNSMWEVQLEPYAGDVFNSYNHGTERPGQEAALRFYELESSSPGAVLEPGQSLVHEHRTFHFLGDRDALDPIARHVLGISLSAFAS
jgi:hypothetical protein